MNRRSALSLSVLALTAAAHAASSNHDGEKLLQTHLAAFVANDLEAVVADYAKDAVFYSPDAKYVGPEQIRLFFKQLMEHFPHGKSTLELDRKVVDGDVVYFTWHANTPTLEVPFATDTILLRDGKIVKQTFAGVLRPVKP